MVLDATQPNCGNLLKNSNTTSLEKSLEGTRVMTGSNGNNLENLDNPQPRVLVKFI